MKKNYLGILIIFFSILSYISFKGTGAYFSDSRTSSNISFTTSQSFPTPTPTEAPIASNLVINEILPVSSCNSGNTNGQYVELWNGSSGTINMQNYKLTDDNNSPIAIANSNITLPQGAFAILVKSNGIINQCLNQNSNNATVIILGGQINLNTGTLRLLDANDNIIDTVKWGNGQDLQPLTNQSIERVPTGKDTAIGGNFLSADFIIKEIYTPGYGTSLVINEFVYKPGTIFPDEWIEIFNPGNTAVNLNGWNITDNASNVRSLSSLGIINTLSFATLDIISQILNNSGSETIFLQDPAGRIIDAHSFTSQNISDQSIGRENNASNAWKICTTPTKNTSNNGSC